MTCLPSLRTIPAALLVFGFAVLAGCDGDGNSTGGAVAAYDLGGPAALPDGSFNYNLTLLYTNDLHDQVLPIGGKRGGMARQATLLRLLREQADERGVGVLSANAGDNLEGTIFFDTDGGVLFYRLLDLAGYNVVQIGNHDHQFGAQFLHDLLSDAFPDSDQNLRFLWGNVNPSEMSATGTDPALVNAAFVPAQVDQDVIDSFENAFVDFDTGAVDTSLMDAPSANSKLFNQTLFYTVNGIRIGLFGLDTDEVLYSSVPGEGDLFLNPDGRSENLRFYSPANHSFASDMITYLNDPDGNPATDDGADVIVAVTHIGLDSDQMVAAQAAGVDGRRIDVIIGGHSHTKLNTSLVVPHLNGSQTLIVQSGSRGEFVGRLDLLVDTTLNRSVLRNCELLQVDDRLEPDAALTAVIQQGIEGPGGVDAEFGAGTLDTPIAMTPVTIPGGIPAASTMGNLAADACLAVGNAAPHFLNLDAMLIGNFVFRGDLCAGSVTVNDVASVLPLNVLDRTGRTNDAVHFVDFPGGVREALDPSTFPLPAPNLTNITSIEYFLEIAYGINDILANIGAFLGIQISGIDSFINGLQWSGITFVVDPAAPALNRIDPSTIFIQGVPLTGNENQSFRVGVNQIIAEIALPFFQVLTMIEDPPASGSFVPFPSYDPVQNDTDLILWQALRDHLMAIGTLGPADIRIVGDRPRTALADLTFNPIDVQILLNGSDVAVQVPVINIGMTPTVSAVLEISMDVTPGDLTDNPDGFTDVITGAASPVLAFANLGPIPAFNAGIPGQTMATLNFSVPPSLPPGRYPLSLRVTQVTTAMLGATDGISANNGGPGFEVELILP